MKLFSEIMTGRVEEFEIAFHIFKFPPFAYIHRGMVKIIDFCIFHGKDKWRMGRNQELATPISCEISYYGSQFDLKFTRHTVFRLVKEI